MKRILLAIITEADICSASFCLSLSDSIKIGLSRNIELFPVFFPANGNWHKAFNQATLIALNEKVDALVSLSPFVSWDPESLFALMDTNKDAVALPVATKSGFDISVNDLKRLQEDPESGEIQVLHSSESFLYLSPFAIRNLCDYLKNDSRPQSICHTLNKINTQVWVNPKHTAQKIESIAYPVNFEDLLRKAG